MRKRIFALLLSLAMLLGMLPVAVFAADTESGYQAAHTAGISIDGQLTEADWLTEGRLSDGTAFGVLWNSTNLYIAVEKAGALAVSIDGQALTVDAEGNVAGIDGAQAKVGTAVEIQIPYTVEAYEDTVSLSIVQGESTWTGDLHFSALVREDYSLKYKWELGIANGTADNLGGQILDGGHRMWAKYAEGAANSPEARVYSGTGDAEVPVLANRSGTITLEYDFVVYDMPAYETWETTRTFCCYGFSMAMSSADKYGYMAGITNTAEGLRFCVMKAEGEKSVLLGKELGETFHIRQDWTMDGDLVVYLDGKLLHTFKGAGYDPSGMSGHGWPNANIVIFNLKADSRNLTSEADNIDFAYSGMRFGKVADTSPLAGLDFDDIKGDNSSPDAITSNLVLPNQWDNGQLGAKAIQWASSAPEVISNTGVITPVSEDTQVTLTASLVSDPSVSKAITVTVRKLAMDSVFNASAITVDGTRNATESWPANMEIGTTSGSKPYGGIASQWHQKKLYFFINYLNTESRMPDTLTLAVADKTWTVDMTQTDVSQNALTGKITGNTVELCVDLKAAGLELLDYGISYDFQVALSGSSGTVTLAENPILLKFVTPGGNVTKIGTSNLNTSLVSGFTYSGSTITLDVTGTRARDYLFTKALTDLIHTKDVQFDQTIEVVSMPVSNGEIVSRLGAEGYCINFCAAAVGSASGQDIITASIYNHATNGLVLRVLQGGAYYQVVQNQYAGYQDIPLGKAVGDTFKLGLRWNADNTLVVYVDGTEKASVPQATIWGSGLSTQSMVFNYYGKTASATDTHKLNISDISLALLQSAPSSIKEELTADKFFGSVDLTAVGENLNLPVTYYSEYLGELDLTWISDDEATIAPDGTVTRPEGTVGKYVKLTLKVGDQELFTVYPYVLPETVLIPTSPKTVGAAFSASAVVVDGATTDEGWSMNTKLQTAAGDTLGRMGVQWDQNNLYLAIETGSLTAAVELDGKAIDLSGAVTANGVLEIAIPFDAAITEYGNEIATKVTLGDATWEGTIVLTSADWFVTGSADPKPPAPLAGSAYIEGVGSDKPTANQGFKQLPDGLQFFDIYDPNGNNPKQVRTYALYGPYTAAGKTLFAPLADRSVGSFLEFDFYAASMPEYTLGEATGWDNRWACYGLSWLLTGEAVDNYADTVAVGIYNSADGLVFVALSDQTYTVKLNRHVGDLFRIGIRWNPDDSLSVFLDGEKIAEFENMTVIRRAMGTNAVNLNLIRGAKAAEGFNDNFDITITNLAVGKAYGDKLIDDLTFDTIRGENTDPHEILSNLTLPAALGNAQLPNGAAITWTSSAPDIIAADGTVTQPENGALVTLTATSGSETKEFELYVIGINTPDDVLFVSRDTDTAHGAGQTTGSYYFTLDADNNSVIRDLKESKTVNVIALRDSDTISRLNESVLTIWVSDDNSKYTQVDSFKLLRSGEFVYLYDFEATGRYIKVHCTHIDGTEADFTAPLQTMIDARFEEVFGANGGNFTEETVTVTNSAAVPSYDNIWVLDGLYQRVLLDGSLLYHYTEDGKTYVRIPKIAPDASVTLTVLSGNDAAMNTENKEYTYEVVYGTRETINISETARWLEALPDGRLINVMSVDEDGDGYANNYIGFNWSSDGGKTWTELQPTGFGYEHCVTVAGVMYDPDCGEYGRIIVQGFSWPKYDMSNGKNSDCKTRFIYSDDLGETWHAPESEMMILGDPTQYYLSYTPPYKVSTADGVGENIDYVMPLGTQPSTDNSGTFVGRVAYTCDSGLSWIMGENEIEYTGEGAYAYEVGVSECTILENSNGRLYLYGRCQFASMDHFAVAYSDDFGKTWSKPVASNIYTVNTQPMFEQFGDVQLLTWAGNTALGGNSYRRYPLNVAYTTDDLQTFENIQNLWSRYSFQGLSEADNLDVTNQSVTSVGDSLMVTWSHYLMKVDHFTDYFFRTKGAYDSFENSTTKYEGWSTVIGTVINSNEQHTDGSFSMKIVDGGSAVRSIPYVQDGKIAFNLYLDDLDGTLQIELESAYADVFGKAAPIALEITDGKLAGLALNQGWNEISFDLALTEGAATITVNGETAALSPDIAIGDYICYVEIGNGTTVSYVDEFIVEDNDPQDIPKAPEDPEDPEQPQLPKPSISLTLNESIDMNFYLKKADIGEDFTLVVKRNGEVLEEGRYTLTETADGRYRVRVSINADKMGDEITVQAFDLEGKAISQERTESVCTYVKLRLKNAGAPVEEKAALIRMLDYGTLAQMAVAGGEVENPANGVLTADERALLDGITFPEATAAADAAIGTKAGSKFSVSLTANETIDMNLYIAKTDMKDGYTIQVKRDGKVLTAGQYQLSETADGRIRVRVSVNADKMNDVIEVQVMKADGTAAYEARSLSVRHFVTMRLNNASASATEKAMMIALADYGTLVQMAAAAKSGTTVTDPTNRYITAEQRAQYDYKWN